MESVYGKSFSFHELYLPTTRIDLKCFTSDPSQNVRLPKKMWVSEIAEKKTEIGSPTEFFQLNAANSQSQEKLAFFVLMMVRSGVMGRIEMPEGKKLIIVPNHCGTLNALLFTGKEVGGTQPHHPSVRKFQDCRFLSFSDRIEDGFFVNEKKSSVMELAEGFLVDSRKDMGLREFMAIHKFIISPDEKTRARMLAMAVSHWMGGSEPETVTKLNQEFEREREILARTYCTKRIPIGTIRKGIHRHRAVLYKYACDKLGIKCYLIQGKVDNQDCCWNAVLVGGCPELFIVDLMRTDSNGIPYIEPANSAEIIKTYQAPSMIRCESWFSQQSTNSVAHGPENARHD